MLPGKLKDCITGQGKDSEETQISGSRNDLLQSCFDLTFFPELRNISFEVS